MTGLFVPAIFLLYARLHYVEARVDEYPQPMQYRSASYLQSGTTSSKPAVDDFTFLDNGVIRLGVDLTRGGTIGWLGPSSNKSLSLLNAHDFGRSVQGSFYSGPSPFDPAGKCSEPGGWGRPWPWNPIGSGDVYLHAAPILNVTINADNTSAVIWTRPLQWACDDVPCDCTFEQHVYLVGKSAQVSLIMHTARVDKTFYGAYAQEFPATYIVGDFCHLYTYNGSSPWNINNPIVEQPAAWGANAWSNFLASERWMAFTNSTGYGVGVISDDVAHFGAGFFDNGKIGVYNCVPKGLGPYDSPTGYISPWSTEIIDPNSNFAYNFSLVLGSLTDIRGYALDRHAAGHGTPAAPAYDFVARGDRAHCTYSDMVDAGPPSEQGLILNISGPHPGVVGPITVFNPSAAPQIVVNVSYSSDPLLQGAVSALNWVVFGDNDVCSACVLTAPIISDGTYHSLTFELATVPAWASASAITRIEFQPLGRATVDPRVYNRALITLASINANP
jgi:hypothetical protein